MLYFIQDVFLKLLERQGLGFSVKIVQYQAYKIHSRECKIEIPGSSKSSISSVEHKFIHKKLLKLPQIASLNP